MTYSEQELIDYGRRVLGFGHIRSDCNLSQTDGVDVDALIADNIRQWYLELLRNGARELLEGTAVAVTASTPLGGAGGARLEVPARCVRVLSVRLKGWHHAVEPLGAAKLEQTMLRQLNPYTAATVRSPVAVASADGSILAWPESAEYGSTEVIGAVDPGAGTYTFAEGALQSLAQHLSTLKIIDYASF